MKPDYALLCLTAASLIICGCSTQPVEKNASTGDDSHAFSSSQSKPPIFVSTTISPRGIGYVIYENPRYKIKMRYPAGLKKQEEISGEVVFLLSPQNSTTDAYPASLDIMVLDVSSQPITLAEFTNQSLDQIAEMVPDYRITDSRKATLAKEDAYLIAYTGSQGLLRLKWMSVYTIKNNTLYLITYTAGADRFQTYLPTVSKMLDSFEITETKAPTS